MQSDPVTICIVTATMNAEKTIERNIRSVMQQSYRVHEHIIVDGGSTDGTTAILKSYQNKYPIRWHSEPDRGIADAMNKGLKRSEGKYLLMLHADDYLLNRNSIARATAKLQNDNFDIYSAPVLMEYECGTRVLLKPHRPLWWYHFKTPFRHQGTLVHQRIFDRVGLFRDRFSITMDYDFFYRSMKIKPSIVYDRQPLSVMGAYGVSTLNDIERIHEEYKVQRMNERNTLWRIVQLLFCRVYRPYKLLTRRRIIQ